MSPRRGMHEKIGCHPRMNRYSLRMKEISTHPSPYIRYIQSEHHPKCTPIECTDEGICHATERPKFEDREAHPSNTQVWSLKIACHSLFWLGRCWPNTEQVGPDDTSGDHTDAGHWTLINATEGEGGMAHIEIKDDFVSSDGLRRLHTEEEIRKNIAEMFGVHLKILSLKPKSPMSV